MAIQLKGPVAGSALLVLVLGLTVWGQSPAAGIPRAADGHPDFQGIWNSASYTPLERPASLGNREFFSEEEAAKFVQERKAEANKDRRDGPPEVDVNRSYNELFYDHGEGVARSRRTSLVIDPSDGRIPPMTPEGRAQLAANRERFAAHPADGPENRPLPDRCLMFSQSGPPMIPGNYNNNYQLVQTGDYLAILAEMGNQVRTIPIEAKPGQFPPRPEIGQWAGVSAAHWEGDDLVVETSNFRFNDKSRFGVQYEGGVTDVNLHITERFTMRQKDWVIYRATITDPTTYSKPWTIEASWERAPGPVYEYACHEGNYAMVDVLGGARAMEKAAAEKR
jgi:hypothetical protein